MALPPLQASQATKAERKVSHPSPICATNSTKANATRPMALARGIVNTAVLSAASGGMVSPLAGSAMNRARAIRDSTGPLRLAMMGRDPTCRIPCSCPQFPELLRKLLMTLQFLCLLLLRSLGFVVLLVVLHLPLHVQGHREFLRGGGASWTGSS